MKNDETQRLLLVSFVRYAGKWAKRETACRGCLPLLLPRTAPVLLSLVLFPGGKAPTDVPLGLVDVQNDLDLFVQGLIVLGQTLG